MGLFMKGCGDFSDGGGIDMIDWKGGGGLCVWVEM